MPKAIAIAPGTVFGRLAVIETARTPGGRRAMLCQCECGKQKIVDVGKLRSGHTQSCGCLHREVVAELARTNPLIAEYRTSDKRREQTRQQATTHGLSYHAHRVRWRNMMSRCTDPDHPAFHRYGGRGIKVCPEWHDLSAFCEWIDANLGPCPAGMSLDRYPDNDGNYEPGNVRWATQPAQIQNSSWAKLTLQGAADIRARAAAGARRKTLAAEYGVSIGTVRLVVIGETWKHH